MSATLGTCTQGRAREVLTGDEVRPCWQTKEVAEAVPFEGLLSALNPVAPEPSVPEVAAQPVLAAIAAWPPAPMVAVPVTPPAPAPVVIPVSPLAETTPLAETAPLAETTPPTGSVIALAAALTSPVDEDSRAVWLAAGGGALLADDPGEPAVREAPVAVLPIAPSIPVSGAPPAPIVAFVPPAPPAPSAPPRAALPAAPSPAEAAPDDDLLPPPTEVPPGPTWSVREPARPVAIPVTPERPPLAPPWAQPVAGPLRPLDSRPEPPPADAGPEPAATPAAALQPSGPATPPGPDAGESRDERRPPTLALLPATLANRFRRGMAGLGWREPAPPLFSSSARLGRATPPLAAPADPGAAVPPPAPEPPPLPRRFTPPPPKTVPGRLVEAPWVPPRASSLSLGEQLRRTELARREPSLPDVERLGGRGGGDAGA